jgi:hypothetical protein
VLLGWIVIRTGSLWFAIAYHVAWNVVAAHVLGLTTSGFDLGASIFTTKLAGPELLTGGSYGFEGSILTELLDLAGLSTALLLARRWPRDERSAPHYARAIASAAPPPPEAGQDLAAPSPPTPRRPRLPSPRRLPPAPPPRAGSTRLPRAPSPRSPRASGSEPRFRWEAGRPTPRAAFPAPA